MLPTINQIDSDISGYLDVKSARLYSVKNQMVLVLYLGWGICYIRVGGRGFLVSLSPSRQVLG
jgi:hypothetical protein